MIKFPPCKVNLGLQVISKRDDGYHEIHSLMYPVPLTDILEIVKAEEFSFESSGLFIPGDSDSNLCIKAFKLMKKKHSIGNVKIHLHKIIPMGGGLGGGSSDCAYTLSVLNELFELNLPTTTLEDYSSELGSDCPFFIKNAAQIATGRGEELREINFTLNGKWLKLVNLNLHISTKEAYQNLELKGRIAYNIDYEKIESWKETMKNDFEVSAFQKFPQLEDVKKKLYNEGARYASMTGSGSTMFAIYDELPVKSFGASGFEEIIQL